jgi:4-amino-4-deoxy-L-arabinose transferase-like glycosyltransferase
VFLVSTQLARSPARRSAPAASSSILMRQRPRMFLAMLFIGALLIRIAAVVVLRNLHVGPSPQFGADPVEFDSMAWNLARGAGYVSSTGLPTSFRAPGFPFFLSAIYAVAGRSYPIVYVALCGLGAASCVITYFLARELLPDRASRVVALLAAVYVPHVYFATLLLSENLFVPILGLVICLLFYHLRTGSLAAAAGAGLFLGVAILTRPFALLLVPILLLCMALQMQRLHTFKRWPAAILLLLCAGAVVAPWTLRNLRVHHHAVLVATNGGSTFYGGNNDKVSALSPAVGTWVSTRSLLGRDRVDATPDEVSHDKLEWQLGIQWVRQHPTQLPLLLSAKAIRLFLPDVDSANYKYVLLNLLGYTPFLVLMLRGATRCASVPSLRTPQWMLIHGVMLATLATALIFWGSPRFRDANMPILMLYAALGIGASFMRAAPEPAEERLNVLGARRR